MAVQETSRMPISASQAKLEAEAAVKRKADHCDAAHCLFGLHSAHHAVQYIRAAEEAGLHLQISQKQNCSSILHVLDRS